MKSLKYMLLLLAIMSVFSCKKKDDFTYDDRLTSTQYSNSNTRIINLSGLNQLTIGGHKLTNYILPRQEQLPPSTGTLYFPTNGSFSNGSTYTIPQNLLNPDGTANVKMDELNTLINGVLPNGADSVFISSSFKTKDNQTNPNDYFVLNWGGSSFAATSDTVVTFPRSVSAPSDPTHIKI